MKPDAYMPYYGNDFEQATKGHRPETKWAYLCAIWHYWHNTHCQGLPNDDDRLRGICEVDMSSWARVRGAIFGTYFKLIDGSWHQDNARKIYTKWNAAYMAKVAGAAKAREIANPDINPDINPDTTSAINPKSESESESESKPQPKPVVGANASRPAAKSSDQIVSELTASGAYGGINIGAEFAKMEIWCKNHRREPTERRFIAWLNRIEPPIAATAPASSGPKLTEVQALCKQKWGDEPKHSEWGAAFFGYWAPRKWQRAGKTIDWPVELSAQVSKWRAAK